MGFLGNLNMLFFIHSIKINICFCCPFLPFSSREREIEKFRLAVSVPSGARMFFSLTYEELLSRRLGRYELSLGLRPGQLVSNLTLDVSISEQTGIRFLKVLPLRASRLLTSTAQGKVWNKVYDVDRFYWAKVHCAQNTGLFCFTSMKDLNKKIFPQP